MFFRDRRTVGYPSRDHYAFQNPKPDYFSMEDEETEDFVHVDAPNAVDTVDTTDSASPNNVTADDEDIDTLHGQQGDSIDISDEDAYPHETFIDRLEREKEENKNNLTQKLRRRSTVEELQEKGILHEFHGLNGTIDHDTTLMTSVRTVSTIGSEPSPEAVQPPTMQKRKSIIRPEMEKHINPMDFKKYRKQIKKRLSSKQRMPFEDLVSRNIRAKVGDEFNEIQNHELSKKVLQLNRRLSFRPIPAEIQESSDLPKDLKIADSEYFKMYHYRDAVSEKERFVKSPSSIC